MNDRYGSTSGRPAPSSAGRPLCTLIGLHNNIQLLAHGLQDEKIIEVWPATIFIREMQHLYAPERRTTFSVDKEYDYVACWYTPCSPGQSYDVKRVTEAFFLLAASLRRVRR